MTNKVVKLLLLCLIPGTLMAEEAKGTTLMSRELTDTPGREILMILVEYPPGGSDPIHRHDAHGLIYVLDGTVVIEVRGGEQVTLTTGQTFHERPEDIHVVGRNASNTKPATFLVFFVKDKGAPLLEPAI